MRAGQAAATKLSQGPASNTCSQSNYALETLLHVASFLDKKGVNAKRLASQKFPLAIFAAALAVMDIDSGKMLKHQQLTNHQDQVISSTWNTSTANKIGRLFQGVGKRIKDSSSTCHFIRNKQIPLNRFCDNTYEKFKCTERNQKAENHITRLVVGGNRINFPGEVGTRTTKMQRHIDTWSKVHDN